MEKKHKIMMAVLIFLLALGLIGTLIFWLPSVSVEWANLIINNPITCEIRHMYWNCLPSLISIPISLANVIYTIMGLRSMYKTKTLTHKRIIGYLIYVIVSLGAIVVNCITFDYVFSCMIAG